MNHNMPNALACVLLISGAGAIGGLLNAIIADQGFTLPSRKHGVLCPGFLGNTLIGAVSALCSWALYGAGASLELLSSETDVRQAISIKLPAFAGALLVGVAGARWLSNEADKRMLKESTSIVAHKKISAADCDEILKASPRQVLESVAAA
jgi:hypothetical protein